MVFKNINDLNKYITKKVESTLITEVAETIRNIEISNIEDDVYDVYYPLKYKRRRENGGLSDERNIEAFVTNYGNKNMKLEIYNTTQFYPYIEKGGKTLTSYNITVPTSLSELVEYGNGYQGVEYDFPMDDKDYMPPRPFTQNTIEELSLNNQHIGSLKTGLKNRGLKVK